MYAIKAVLALGLIGGVAGCRSDRPHEYGRQRPAVDTLDGRDRGLQSKDVVTASEQMAREILAIEELRRSEHQWTIVVDRFEDRTLARHFSTNYDIFIERLRVNLSKYGNGQVQLIENKAKLNQLRSRELDIEGDDFGQGAGGRPMPRIQADYALYGKVFDMPNRGTNYYMLEFTATNMKNGLQAWSGKYEVKVGR